jgi:hypothetical protein
MMSNLSFAWFIYSSHLVSIIIYHRMDGKLFSPTINDKQAVLMIASESNKRSNCRMSSDIYIDRYDITT